MNNKELDQSAKIIQFPTPERSGNFSIGDSNQSPEVKAPTYQSADRPTGRRVYRRTERQFLVPRAERNPRNSRPMSGAPERTTPRGEQPPRPPETEIELPPFGEDPLDWYFSQVDQAKEDRDNTRRQSDKLRELIQQTDDKELKQRYNRLLSHAKTKEGAKEVSDLIFLNDLQNTASSLRLHEHQYTGRDRTKASYAWQIVAPMVEYQEYYKEKFDATRLRFEKLGSDIRRPKDAEHLFKGLSAVHRGFGDFTVRDLCIGQTLEGEDVSIGEVPIPETDKVYRLRTHPELTANSQTRVNELNGWYQQEFVHGKGVDPDKAIDAKLDHSVNRYFHRAMGYFERRYRVFNDTEREDYEQFLKNLKPGLEGKYSARRWFLLHYLDFQDARGGALNKLPGSNHISAIPQHIILITQQTPGAKEVFNLYEQQATIRWLEFRQLDLKKALGEMDDPVDKDEDRQARLARFRESEDLAREDLERVTAEINERRDAIDEMCQKAAEAMSDDEVTPGQIRVLSEVYSGVEGFESDEPRDPRLREELKNKTLTTNAFRLVQRFREVTALDAEKRKFAELPRERGEEKVNYGLVKNLDFEGWLIKEGIPTRSLVVGTPATQLFMTNFWQRYPIPFIISSAFEKSFDPDPDSRAESYRLKKGITAADFGLPDKFKTKDGDELFTLPTITNISSSKRADPGALDNFYKKNTDELAKALLRGQRGEENGLRVNTAEINWHKISLDETKYNDIYQAYWVDMVKQDTLRKELANFLREGSFTVGEGAAIDKIKAAANDLDPDWSKAFSRRWSALTNTSTLAQIRSIRQQARAATQDLPISVPLEEAAVPQILPLTFRGGVTVAAVFEKEHYETYLACLKNPDGTDKFATLYDFYENPPNLKDGAILVASLLGGGAYRPRITVGQDGQGQYAFDNQGRLERDYIVGDHENGGRALVEAWLNYNDRGNRPPPNNPNYILYEEFLSYAGLKYDIDKEEFDKGNRHHKRVRFAKGDELHTDGTALIEENGNKYRLSDHKKGRIEAVLKHRIGGTDDQLWGLAYGWSHISGKIVGEAAKLYTATDHAKERQLYDTIGNYYEITDNLVPQLRQPEDLPQASPQDNPQERFEKIANRQLLVEQPITSRAVDPMAASLTGNWYEWPDIIKQNPGVQRTMPLRLYYDKILTIKELYLNWSSWMADERGETEAYRSTPTPADWHYALMDLEREIGGSQHLTKDERTKLEADLNITAENVGYQAVARTLNNIPDKRGEQEKDRYFDGARRTVLGLLPGPFKLVGSFIVPKLLPPGAETVTQGGLAFAGGTIGFFAAGPGGAVLGASAGWLAGNDWDHRTNWIPAGWGRAFLSSRFARRNTIPGTGIKIGAHEWPFDPKTIATIVRRKLGVYTIRE